MKYELIKDYKQDDNLRKSFHELTQKTFDFNLEDWYKNGFWSEKYIPYSLIDEGKVIANVSVNLMNLVINGVQTNYIQLGTVMTDEAYRNQGLAGYLMGVVQNEYQGKTNGIYLFANDSVLDFYPKFGFTKCSEYKYRKILSKNMRENHCKKVDMSSQENRCKVLDMVKNMTVNNNVHMNNYGLYAFWLTGLMSNQIYYCENEDTYVIADIQGEVLFLNQIISDHYVDLNAVISSFGDEISEVILEFTPLDTSEFLIENHKEEDSTLFVLGEELHEFERQKLRFPPLSHA